MNLVPGPTRSRLANGPAAPARPVRARAFTIKADGRLDRIVTDVRVCAAFDPVAHPTPLPPQVQTGALWDTGATKSGISSDLAHELNLTPVGTATVRHAGGSSEQAQYLVNFVLPNDVGVVGALVTGLPPIDGFGALLGMDVIALGDFSITNVDGRTWMSFRFPSRVGIDYVVEEDRARFAGVRANDPCPCGSGKKFKKCHRP